MVSIPKGTLIDIETTGLNWDYDEIVLFGYVEGNCLMIICRTSEEEEPFIAQIANLIPKLSKPFYAYNFSFEKSFLKAKGIDKGGGRLVPALERKSREALP